MGFQKNKSDFYCVGGGHRSSTKNICGDITSTGSKTLFGYCSIWNRKRSMTVSDNAIRAKNLRDFFFEKLGQKDLTYRKGTQKTF